MSRPSVLFPLAMAVAAALAGQARPSLPAPAPTPIPTPVPPERVPDTSRKGVRVLQRVGRYPSADVVYSRLLRVEEADLDGDGVFEALVDGIGTVRNLPEGIPTSGIVSRTRLPFESRLLTVLRREGSQWKALFIGHVPLACGQTGDLSRCDQLLDFRCVWFRLDDRPQVLFHVTHAGENGTDEVATYRFAGGHLEATFASTEPRSAVDVTVTPLGIQRRIAVDTFINRDLPQRYRSFTLSSLFTFGERAFRVQSEAVEEAWGERRDFDLAYWGLVHQKGFGADLDRLREREKKASSEAPWVFDPVELVKKRLPDATQVRIGTRQEGVAIVDFERAGCAAHAVLYQPLREWDGGRGLWEIALIRVAGGSPYECLREAPLR